MGYTNSVQFHVFEITRQLPRFSMYSLLRKTTSKQLDSFVEIKINERLQRICMWINQNFLLANDIEAENGPTLKVHLKCLRDKSELTMSFDVSGKTVFYTEKMSLAADLVQSVATFLKIENLQVSFFTNICFMVLKIESTVKSVVSKRRRKLDDLYGEVGRNSRCSSEVRNRCGRSFRADSSICDKSRR